MKKPQKIPTVTIAEGSGANVSWATLQQIGAGFVGLVRVIGSPILKGYWNITNSGKESEGRANMVHEPHQKNS